MSLLIGQGQYDYIAGGNSPINRIVLKEDGNWKDLNIPNEIQVINSGDANAYDTSECVTFNGVTDACEYIMMQMLRLNMIPAESVNWLKDSGYFKDGVINFNEPYTGIKGNTTKIGAYQFVVANGASNWGFIPQDMLPFGKDFNDNIDPKRVTPEMEKMGLEFLNHFVINYERVDNVEDYIKYSPISCFGKYGNMINDVPIKKTDKGSNHSMLIVANHQDSYEIDDSYWQQFKKYEKDALSGFMAFYITPLKTSMDTTQFLKDNDKKWVRNSNTGAFGRVLQNKLFLFPTEDRAVLALLDDKVRENGIQISDAEWGQLDKQNF